MYFCSGRSNGNAPDGQTPAATTLLISSAVSWTVPKQYQKKPGLLVPAEQVVAIDGQKAAALVQHQDLRKIIM